MSYWKLVGYWKRKEVAETQAKECEAEGMPAKIVTLRRGRHKVYAKD